MQTQPLVMGILLLIATVAIGAPTPTPPPTNTKDTQPGHIPRFWLPGTEGDPDNFFGPLHPLLHDDLESTTRLRERDEVVTKGADPTWGAYTSASPVPTPPSSNAEDMTSSYIPSSL